MGVGPKIHHPQHILYLKIYETEHILKTQILLFEYLSKLVCSSGYPALDRISWDKYGTLPHPQRGKT